MYGACIKIDIWAAKRIVYGTRGLGSREREKIELKVRKVQAGDITQLTTILILYHATAMRQPTVYDRYLPSHLLDAVST